jgi:hypothetical protein
MAALLWFALACGNAVEVGNDRGCSCHASFMRLSVTSMMLSEWRIATFFAFVHAMHQSNPLLLSKSRYN